MRVPCLAFSTIFSSSVFAIIVLRFFRNPYWSINKPPVLNSSFNFLRTRNLSKFLIVSRSHSGFGSINLPVFHLVGKYPVNSSWFIVSSTISGCFLAAAFSTSTGVPSKPEALSVLGLPHPPKIHSTWRVKHC